MSVLGIDNRNPLNIKQSERNPWEGSAGADKAGHAIFRHEIYGIRAACRILARYQLEKGCKTLVDYLRIWAPASDTLGSVQGQPQNSPESYAAFVNRKVGFITFMPFRADRTLIGNQAKSDLAAVLHAMAEYENYAGYDLCMSTIKSGIALYERDFR